MRKTFDFEQALKAVQSSQAVPGKDGVLAPLVKPRTEAALEGELDSPLADDVARNRGNGHATAFPPSSGWMRSTTQSTTRSATRAATRRKPARFLASRPRTFSPWSSSKNS